MVHRNSGGYFPIIQIHLFKQPMASSKESWKEIKITAKGRRTRYGISSRGRICSFNTGLKEKKVLKGTIVNGYPALKLKIQGRDFQYYVHKLVAEYFCGKPSRSKPYVIHRDFNRLNNKASNLRWASGEEVQAHQQKSPRVKSYRERTRQKGHKLTAGKVQQIKAKIFSPKRVIRMKDIAKQFGISEMQLYRIKSGENWSHIKK